MPKWEGIEDASAFPQPVWLSRGGGGEDDIKKSLRGNFSNSNNKQWFPLRKCDCRLINETKETRVTTIDGGRATADLENMILSYNFIDRPSRQLTSSIWFYPSKNEKGNVVLFPFTSKQDEIKVEELYQRVVAASGSLVQNSQEEVTNLKNQEVMLEDGNYKVVLVLSGNHWVLRKKSRALISLEVGVDLQRGYGSYSVPGEVEEMELGPVTHLYFVIHGIGEAMWTKQDKSMIDETDTLRSSINKRQHDEWKKTCQRATKLGEELPPPPDRVEFIPIEWFSQIHSASSTLKSSLTSSTLGSIPLLRNIANDVVFDVLMYLTPEFCEKVIRIVTDQICDLYAGYRKVHPDFQGRCSIVGHSLGSVIAWDLLCILHDNSKRINYDPKKNKKGDSEGEDEDEESKNEGTRENPISILPSLHSSMKKEEIVSNFELPVAGENKMAGYQAYIEKEGDKYAARAGTWGPRLPQRMTKFIPFVPHVTILLGSPLGMFLTLRGAHPVFEEMRVISESASWVNKDDDSVHEIEHTSPFCLPSGAIYNIFHPSDPVAYRIEPLLLPPLINELPPPSFLVLRGKGTRLHIKAKEFGDNVRKSFSDMFQRNQDDSDKKSDAHALATTLSLNQNIGFLRRKRKNDAPNMKKTLNFPLGGRSDRVDFQLQTGVVENEYISAVSVHGNYFTNSDIIDFLIECGVSG